MERITLGVWAVFMAACYWMAASGDLAKVQAQEKPAPAKWIVYFEPQVAEGDVIGTAYATAFVGSLDKIDSIRVFATIHQGDASDAFVIRVMTTPSCEGKTIVHVFLLRHTQGTEFDAYLGGLSGAVLKGDEVGAAEESNIAMAKLALQYMKFQAAKVQ